MTRQRTLGHDKIEKVPLPPMIALYHNKLALFIDFFYVNENIFFHSKSEQINFLTAQYCTSRSLKTIMTALERIINKYNARSFCISDIHGDNEFDKAALKEFLEPAIMHVYMAKLNMFRQLRDLCGQSKKDVDLHATVFLSRESIY